MTTKTKKKTAGLDALKNISKDNIEDPILPLDSPPTKQSNKKPFPLHLPLEVHDALREMSFYQRKSMTKLVLDGIDLLFEKNGLPSIKEMIKE